MREEDIDWSIYHIIASENCISLDNIVSKTGFELNTVQESLIRLEKKCLICLDGENARILSIQEAMIKNKINNAVNDPDSPVIIENGIIKANPDYKG